MPNSDVRLCGIHGCRLIEGHEGRHSATPMSVFNFMEEKDRNKINKTGYATPRGGAKGAYQNHVYRNNRVIIPYEKLSSVNLSDFSDGYIIRLLPEQYFSSPGKPRDDLEDYIIIGENAFILYRTHESLSNYPPLEEWSPRALIKDGKQVHRRGKGVIDTGHYVLRIPRHGSLPKRIEGPPQGIFAPEYADAERNYLSQCALAWLIIHTVNSPYTTSQASHLKAILSDAGILDDEFWERQGILKHGLCACPLCSKLIYYSELHDTLQLDDEHALENASEQIEGATRSTIVNLFHMDPLRYGSIEHEPSKVAWGHATCNTRLGQRKCYSLTELLETGEKVGIIRPDGIDTFGWISPDWDMIRSPQGSVWIRICRDLATPDNDNLHLKIHGEDDKA